MKKTTLFFAAILIFITANAQFRVGATAGFGVASALVKPTSSTEVDTKPILGFQVGAVAEVGIAKSIYFRPGLVFMRRGTRTELSGAQSAFKQTTTLNYITLPLNFFYNLKVSKASVFFGLGPQIGFGISGKAKNETTIASVTTTSDNPIDFGTNKADDDLRPFDAGLNVEAGVEFPCSFGASLFYTAGLTNIDLVDNATWRNNVFGLSLFYFFY